MPIVITPQAHRLDCPAGVSRSEHIIRAPGKPIRLDPRKPEHRLHGNATTALCLRSRSCRADPRLPSAAGRSARSADESPHLSSRARVPGTVYVTDGSGDSARCTLGILSPERPILAVLADRRAWSCGSTFRGIRFPTILPFRVRCVDSRQTAMILDLTLFFPRGRPENGPPVRRHGFNHGARVVCCSLLLNADFQHGNTRRRGGPGSQRAMHARAISENEVTRFAPDRCSCTRRGDRPIVARRNRRRNAVHGATCNG